MRALILTVTFLFFNFTNGQDIQETTEKERRLIKLCDVCTCSEIPDMFDGTHLVLNIQCSELDKIENVPDLDKIEWPENANGLKISSTFEGLGLTTLGKLPPNSQVETLRFNNNAIKAYWPDPFTEVPSLKRLSLANNELDQITPDLFTRVQFLEDLDLSYNKLSEFNSLDFKTLEHLKTLSLKNNQIKKIPVEALQPLKALEDLDLSKNGIFDVLLRSDLGVFGSLKSLNFNGNKIRSVTSDSFPANNSIELLDLSNNVIELVEENAFATCIYLKELNLAQNNITFNFFLPQSLQIIRLRANTIHRWPEFPSGITYVDLSYNRLTAIYDESTVRFDNLEVLNIGGNQIAEINLEQKLSNLTQLDLSYNHIAEIPKCLNDQILPKLEDLHLDGNPLDAIYFKNIIILRSLYLNDLNNLKVVEEKAFSNVIGRSQDETKDDRGCFSLYLSNCESLSDINENAFDDASLCMLDISHNNLSYISPKLLDWSSLSSGVDLQNNPWQCSCKFQWVLDDLLPLMYTTPGKQLMLTELRCGSPRALEGLRLVHWYNWTDQPMCNDDFLRSGNYLLQPSTQSTQKVTSLTYILGGSIILGLFIAIGLFAYLIRTRKKKRVRESELERKRQNQRNVEYSNELQKEDFVALNKT